MRLSLGTLVLIFTLFFYENDASYYNQYYNSKDPYGHPTSYPSTPESERQDTVAALPNMKEYRKEKSLKERAKLIKVQKSFLESSSTKAVATEQPKKNEKAKKPEPQPNHGAVVMTPEMRAQYKQYKHERTMDRLERHANKFKGTPQELHWIHQSDPAIQDVGHFGMPETWSYEEQGKHHGHYGAGGSGSPY